MYMAMAVLLTSSGIKQVPARLSILLLPSPQFPKPESFNLPNWIVPPTAQFIQYGQAILSYTFVPPIILNVCTERDVPDSDCDAALKGIASDIRYVYHMSITSTNAQYVHCYQMHNAVERWLAGWLCAATRMTQLVYGDPQPIWKITRATGTDFRQLSVTSHAQWAPFPLTDLQARASKILRKADYQLRSMSAPIVRNLAKCVSVVFSNKTRCPN